MERVVKGNETVSAYKHVTTSRSIHLRSVLALRMIFSERSMRLRSRAIEAALLIDHLQLNCVHYNLVPSTSVVSADLPAAPNR